MSDTKPPPPLTPKEAEKLVAWLNFAAQEWPRIVGTLVLQRIPVRLEELQPTGLPWDATAGPPHRTPNIGMGRDGDCTMSFVDLLAVMFPTPMPGIMVKVTHGGTAFSL